MSSAGWRTRSEALGKLSPSVLGALDSLVGSGTMFVIQLSILLLASKTEFGRYSLAMSYVVMGQAVFSVFFGAPLLTALCDVPGEDRVHAANSAMRWQLQAALVTGVIVVPILVWLVPGFSPALAIPAALAFVGLTYREAQRITWTVELSMWRALINSLLFSLTICLLLGLSAATFDHIGAGIGFALIALAVLATNPLRIGRTVFTVSHVPHGLWQGLRALALWTAPSVAVIWIQNNLYLTIVAAYLNLAAVAEVSAGRLLGLPYLLVSSGLLRVAQVRFRDLLDRQERDEVARMLRHSVLMHLIGGAFFALVLYGIGNIGGPLVASRRYPELWMLGACWAIFAGVTTARSSVSALFQATGRYKEVFVANCFAIPVVLGSIVVLVPIIGVAGAVLPMVVGELQLLVTLLLILRHRPARPVVRSSAA